jgi:ribosomal protein L30/L7E
MLKNVRVLKMDGCPLITYFTGLNVFKDLTTGFIKVYDPLRTLTITSGVETFSRLETLVLWGYSFEETTETTLNDSSQLSWNHLVNIRHLKLYETTFTRFPEIFLYLQSLKIVRCNELFFLPDLPATLGSLLLEDCSKLTDLHISGANMKYSIYNVDIKGCLNLLRLKVSRKVSSMVITKCKELLGTHDITHNWSFENKILSQLVRL